MDRVKKSVTLSVEQNVPPVPEAPQRLAEVGQRELVCVPRGGVHEERDRPDARQTRTPSVESPEGNSKADVFDYSTFNCEPMESTYKWSSFKPLALATSDDHKLVGLNQISWKTNWISVLITKTQRNTHDDANERLWTRHVWSAALIQCFQTAPALTKPFANQIVSVVCRFVRAELWCAEQVGLKALRKPRSGQRKHNVVITGEQIKSKLLLNLKASCYICKTKSGFRRRGDGVVPRLIISRELLRSC